MALISSHWQYGGEQRRTQRFAVEREVVYQADSAKGPIVGSGRTLNISSGGVLFTSEHPFEVGQQLELSISWPTKLDGKHPLKLVVVGPVVRHNAEDIAMEIQHYDFRIRGSNALRVRTHPMTSGFRLMRARRRIG